MISLSQKLPRTRRSCVNEAIHLALAVTASVSASNAEAQIPCPVTTPLNITDAQVNAVTCDNYSALSVLAPGGSLTNQYMATLNNNSGASLTNNQELNNFWDINNRSGGTITNTGSLYQSVNSGIYNQGALINSGTVNSNGGIQSFGLSSTMVNESTGVINTSGTGLLANDNDSTFDNYGQINSAGELANVGPLHNHSSGLINSQAGLNNYGPLYNDGILNSSAYGIIHNPGTLNNYSNGTVNNGGQRFDNYNGTISNAGTFNNDTRLNNSGTVNNQSGGTLTNTSGIYNYNGGVLTNAGQFEITNTGVVGFSTDHDDSTGSFLQTDGSTIVDGSLQAPTIGFTGGILLGSGTLESIAPIAVDTGASVNPGRTIADAPGNFTGELSVLGDFSLDGTLVIEIADLTDFDLLDVSGDALFSNVSEVQFILSDTFTPQAGDMITFLLAAGLVNWEDVNYSMIELPTGLDFEVFATLDSDLTLKFVPIPAALPLFGSGLAGLVLLARRRKHTPKVRWTT